MNEAEISFRNPPNKERWRKSKSLWFTSYNLNQLKVKNERRDAVLYGGRGGEWTKAILSQAPSSVVLDSNSQIQRETMAT